MHSHLLLSCNVTYVHWALGQLSHHEDGSDTLPLCMSHNGEVGWPRLEVLRTERTDEGKCRAFDSLLIRAQGSQEPPESSLLEANVCGVHKPGDTIWWPSVTGTFPTSIHWATLSSRSSEKVSLR